MCCHDSLNLANRQLLNLANSSMLAKCIYHLTTSSSYLFPATSICYWLSLWMIPYTQSTEHLSDFKLFPVTTSMASPCPAFSSVLDFLPPHWLREMCRCYRAFCGYTLVSFPTFSPSICISLAHPILSTCTCLPGMPLFPISTMSHFYPLSINVESTWAVCVWPSLSMFLIRTL